MSSWPSSNSSNLKLLGLFYDVFDSNGTSALTHVYAMFRSAILLSQEYNIAFDGKYLQWDTIQTSGDIMGTLRDTCESVMDANVVGIIGPGLSREADIIAHFAETVGLPVISHAATDPELSNRQAYPNFYRTVPSDKMAALAIADLFIRLNWASCIIIYQNDAFGSGGANAINDAFMDNNLTVTDVIVFDPSTHQIRGNLQAILKDSAARIVVLWAQRTYTSIILKNALEADVLGPQFTWILSTTASLDIFDVSDHSKLIGILTIEPVTGGRINEPINVTLLDAAYRIWQKYEPDTFPKNNDVYDYALFAFDATWTLIKSLENICSKIANSSSTCLSFNHSSFCFDYRFLQSKELFDAIMSIQYLGVSGPIQFSSRTTDRITGLYYRAQNIQPLISGIEFVPVLEYDDENRWKLYEAKNVIVWPGNSLTIPSGRAKLEGATLRIVINEAAPFIIVTPTIDKFGKNTTKTTGYIMDLIDELQVRLKFLPKIQLAPAGRTYADLIQDISQGVYDVFIGDVTVTSLRRESVAFSNSIFDNSLRIVTRKSSGIQVNLLSFLNPFSLYLWLLVLCAFIYAALLFWFLERKHNESLQQKSVFSQLSMSFWYGFGNIVGYGVEFNAVTPAGRLLTVGLYILSLVLVATYTANLASDLTLFKSQDMISGIDDIKKGKVPFSRIGIRVGTASEEFYLREISGEIKNYYPIRSRKEAIDSLLSGAIDVTFMDSGVANYLTNSLYCNLTLVGTDFDKSSFGIAVPKRWLYSQELDITILELRESGVLEHLRKTWFETSQCLESSKPSSTSMAMEAMGGLFLVFTIISILSLLLYIVNRQTCFQKKFEESKSLS